MDRDKAVEMCKRFAKEVGRDGNVSGIYLFGSWAHGMGKEESDIDIDIAVVFDDFENTTETQAELMRKRRKIDSRIEPHPFRMGDFNSENPFAKEIINTGFRVY